MVVLICRDHSSGLAGYAVQSSVQVSDNRLVGRRGGCEGNSSLDLWKHCSCSELSFIDISGCLLNREMI